jgi:hypothetical protein
VEWKACFWLSFSSIFFGIDPKKKQKKSRAKDATSALFLHLEKLEKTSESFFCFSTAPKFTPPPARLLPEATALYKAVLCAFGFRAVNSIFHFQFSTATQASPLEKGRKTRFYPS